MNEEELNEIYYGVYIGLYTLSSLPQNLYEHYAGTFQKGVYKGYRKSIYKTTFASEEWTLLNHFRENVNVFSGVRTYQEINDFQNFILDNKGALRPFNDYLNDVKKISDIYGKKQQQGWLRTEYNTSVAQGQSARKWMDIEKNATTLPYLRYVTQGDERVRHSHAALDGFTARYDDNYWSSIMPINSYGCRCRVEQLSEASVSSNENIQERLNTANEGRNPDEQIKSLHGVPDKLFKMNPAKDKLIFKNEGIGAHPYFKVSEAYEVQKINNFGFGTNYSI